MASATAFVLIGSPHPNDNGIGPEWLLELWEGSVARWSVRNLRDGQPQAAIEPSSPADIGPSLVRFISKLPSAETAAISVVVSALENSSIISHLDLLKSLRECDVHVLLPTYSRTFSSWSQSWNESHGGSQESNQ